ncbi:energy-coupling factor ABC transporter ATP-binding protein [candidate division KSB1 bacterium]
MVIELRNIHFAYPSYPDKDVLSDLNCLLRPGERVGVIGKTGAGKSTFLQLCAGLLEPTGGVITINDRPAAKSVIWSEYRRNIGLVFQFPENQLFEESVFDDVAFGVKKYYNGREQVEQSVLEALENVGLQPEMYVKRSPHRLSSGEKRRVAIAGVIAMNPDFLFLDEPTIGLDYSGLCDIESALLKLSSQGKTVCTVSHNLDFITRFSERLIVLKDRTIKFDGPTRALFMNNELREELCVEKPEIVAICETLAETYGEDITGSFKIEEVLKYLQNRH